MSNPFSNLRAEDVARLNARTADSNARFSGKPLPSLVSPPSTSKAVERERDLHDDIKDLCKSRGYLYRHDRMDKPTTGQVGWPDWTIFMPGSRVVFLECKAKRGKTTVHQLAKLAHAAKFGFTAAVVDNFQDALRIIDNES